MEQFNILRNNRHSGFIAVNVFDVCNKKIGFNGLT